MHWQRLRRWLLALCSAAVWVSACGPAPVVGRTPTAQPATPLPSATTEMTAPEHRIGVRTVDGVGEFYDRATGEAFVPRGNNYVRLDPQPRDDGSTQVYHSVFDPGLYDRPEITAAFDEMQSLGYNTVRAFLSQNTMGTGSGLKDAYMANVIDFLELAAEHDLYVILTQDWLPGGPYGRILNQDCCDTFNMNNVNYLAPSGLEANEAYFRDFASYLVEHHARLDYLLAYELRNEMFADMDFPPLSWDSGTVEGLNGETYDMSSLEDKHRMADENMVVWMDTLRQAILEVDPTALVSVGFFWPQEPNPARIGDPRYINTAPAIWESELDFIDLHPYPGAELTMAEYAENFGIDGMQEKPLLMGEFGIATRSVSSVGQAAATLMDWQVESCDYGFDGWLLWSWNIYENNDFYSAQSDQGQIGQALAPVNRPDPCQPAAFDFIERNVALGADVRVSRSLTDEPPENAVDGTAAKWGAGASPPQWILLDLGEPHSVGELRLSVSQTPAGQTTHRLYVGSQADDLQLVHTFDGVTEDGQVLVFTPESPLPDVRYVQVVTSRSPSWVAWNEIEVIEAP